MPRGAHDARGAVWDSLETFERGNRWAASETLATALIDSIGKSPHPDSLALARAMMYFASSRLHRRLHADGRGVELLEQAIGIRERRAAPDDTLATWGHVRAATMFTEAGHADRAV